MNNETEDSQICPECGGSAWPGDDDLYTCEDCGIAFEPTDEAIDDFDDEGDGYGLYPWERGE